MNIIQCSFCKKPFHTLGGKICTECNRKMDEDFIKVRDYIYDHNDANIDKVSEETEVSKHVIVHLLKEGRLIINDGQGGGGGMLFCEVCKKPLNTGRMCDGCKGKLASTMQKNVATPKPPGSRGSELHDFHASAKIKKT